METETTNTQQQGESGTAEPQQDALKTESEAQQNAPGELPSDSDINDRISRAISEERSKWEKELETRIKQERDDAANLANMSEKEKQKELEERQRKADAEERAKLEREKNVFHAERTLADKGIPIEFAETLTGKDNEETDANIERFNKMFREAVTKAKQ